MKKLLLVFNLLFCSLSLISQNVWTGGGDDANWSNADNWSGNVPNNEDVRIPTGFTVTLDTPASILSIKLEGNSTLNVTESLEIFNPSEFESNTVVNWSGGDLDGGNVSGLLINSGTINMSFNGCDFSGSITLNNNGTINMLGSATIIINPQSVLNNSGTGTIVFKSNGTQITKAGSAPNVLNNYGTIKTDFPDNSDEAFIACQVINHDGRFQIDNGSLSLNNTVVNLMSGEYNVFNGATLNWNSPTTITGILTGNVVGDLNWTNDLIVESTAVFDFMQDGIINCSGDLMGGGTLTNKSTINRIGSGTCLISEETTLDNEGELVMSGGDIFIGTNSVFNNTSTGTVSFEVSGSEFVSSGASPNTFSNEGVIGCDLNAANDFCSIRVDLTNEAGTFNVDQGVLNLQDEDILLNSGTYNVASGGSLTWIQDLSINGVLTGTVNGVVLWDSDLIVTQTASFNFSGENGVINWDSGFLQGGGVLTNNFTIDKISGGSKRIDVGTTLNNGGVILQSIGGQIGISTNAALNNLESGVIDFQSTASGFNVNGVAPQEINNAGIIRTSMPAGNATISVPFSNSGIIDVSSGELDITSNFSSTGSFMGLGVLDLSNAIGFTNEGTISPGASPGTLNYKGNYTSTNDAVIDIELDGLTQDSEYDLFAIDGNAEFNGDLVITLGFEPSVNDTFVIGTTTGTINSCNLPTTVNSDYNSSTFEFEVDCVSGNQLVLTVVMSTLGVDDFNSLDDFKITPNPVKDSIYFPNLEVLTVEIYNLNGQLVLTSRQPSISLSNLPEGLYFAKITEAINGNSTTKKFIKSN